jgi:hypothetical protein
MKGELSWLTLPLKKAPTEIRIANLDFTQNPACRLIEQQNKFPIFCSPSYLASEFKSLILQFSYPPVVYITKLLELTCSILQLPFQIFYSSQLQLSPDLKGQDRIITICKHFNAKTYINSPGGRELYNEDDFKKNNIILKFLSHYSGSYESILPRLFNESISNIRNEIISQGGSI